MPLNENILHGKQKSCILLICEELPNCHDPKSLPKSLAQPAVFLAVFVSKAGHIGSF